MSADDVSGARVNYDDLDFDDQLALRDGVPFTGIVFSEHVDGSLETEGHYREGLPDGLQQYWYRGGQIERRWIAVRGHGASEGRTWYRNGQLRSVKRYEVQRLVEAAAWNEAGEPIDPASLGEDNAFGKSVPGTAAQ